MLPLWVKNWRMFGRNRRTQVRNVYCKSKAKNMAKPKYIKINILSTQIIIFL